MTADERNALILEMRRNGSSQDQIASRLGVTQQRVSQKLIALVASERVTGRPCPKCESSSKTIKTFPPTRESTKRKHLCKFCGFEWTTTQKDDL